MKSIGSLISALFLLGAMLQAQNTVSSSNSQVGPPGAQNAPLHIANGSVIPVQLSKTVDAKKAKSGDAVEAKVTQDLKSNSGDVIVPKDTKIVGRVTQAQQHGKEQKESELGITFDHAVMKNGDSVALPMSIQAVIAPETLNPAASSGSGIENPGGVSGNNSSRSGPIGGSPSRMPTPSGGDEQASGSQTGGSARPPLTATTQGVIGIPDLNLAAGANPTQGSLLSSQKNNVKLESGTLMLLRVNQ